MSSGRGKWRRRALWALGIGAAAFGLLVGVWLVLAARMVPAPDPSKPSPIPASAPLTGQRTLIRGEARLLRGTTPQALLHPAPQIAAVYTFDDAGNRIDYREGADWRLVDGRIARTENSAIPDFDRYRYSPAGPCLREPSWAVCRAALRARFTPGDRQGDRPFGAPVFWFVGEARNPPLTIGYDVYFDYTASVAPGMITAAGAKAGDVEGSLADARKVVCLGDSITAGAHTIAEHYRSSDAQSWCGLMAQQFRGRIAFVNLSKGGAGMSDFKALYRDARPQVADADAVIIAPGMNHHVHGTVELNRFIGNLDGIVRGLQDEGKAVLLVGFFQQNPLWVDEVPHDTAVYNDAIQRVAAKRGTPFVEMLKTFERYSPTHEGFYHLTGDFMHHPNTYGQRIYFSQILPHFLTGPLPYGAAPDFIIPAPEI